MDADTAKKLREPFPAEVIGKLPRVTCRDCSQRSCQKHQKSKCNECGNYISTAHIHLSYVGHAAVTDRLLQTDPGWSWEPVAFGQDGLPALDRNSGLWIRLTVAGVTRLGYGHADGKQGADAVKEAIGDALRNGAMRFGVGLDLWHKDGELVPHDDTPAAPQGNGSAQPRNGAQEQRKQPSAGRPLNGTDDPVAKAKAALKAECEKHGWDLNRVAERFQSQYGQELKDCTDPNRIRGFMKLLPDAMRGASNGAQA